MNDSSTMPWQPPALLLIDDEVSLLRSVERLMAGSHLRVLTFSDPTVAIPLFADPSVAVIVSDFRMPLFRGTDVLARAKKDNRFARRILLSSHADIERDCDGTGEACAHLVIGKPYDPTALRARILQAAVDARFDALVSRLPSLLRSLQLCAAVPEVRAVLSEAVGILGAEVPAACIDRSDLRWSLWGRALREANAFPDREDSVIELILSAASIAVTRLSWERGPSRKARIDSLTSLASEQVFETALGREQQRAVRYGTPLSVALMDINRFSDIEQRTGDGSPIRSLAQILRHNIRSIDVAMRRSGRGFSILFPGLSPQRVVAAMRRINALIAAWAATTTHWGNLTTSVGVAQFSTEGEAGEPFVVRADSALCYAREHGPNGIAIHDKSAIVAC